MRNTGIKTLLNVWLYQTNVYLEELLQKAPISSCYCQRLTGIN